MYKLKISLFFVFMNLGLVGFSQRTTIGFLSGINFSDINNSSTSGKWQSKPGPLAGFYLNYKLNNSIALYTEINYLTLYYQYESYFNPNYYPLEYYKVSSFTYLPWPSTLNWSFSYLRLPVMLKFYTPTRLSFHFSAGGFIAQMIGSNNQNYIVLPEKEPLDSDYGLMFATGLSYNLMNKLNLSIELRYAAGKKMIINYDNGQNGDMEISFGLAYVFTSKKGNKSLKTISYPDTLNPKISIKYSAGANVSQNFGENINVYDPGIGFSGGLSLIYHANKAISFQTDILYERKSYGLNDSSSVYFYYKLKDNNKLVDTKTDIDYISIPIIMNVFFDKKARFYINTGFYGAIRMNARVTGYAYELISSETQYLSQKIHVYDNIEGEFRNADLGWIIGAGFQPSILKKYKLDIGLRYSSSFGNIYKEAVHYDGIKLRSLSLTMGLIIPII